MLKPFSFDTQFKTNDNISRRDRYYANIWRMPNVQFIDVSMKFKFIQDSLSIQEIDCEIDDDFLIVILKIYHNINVNITNEIEFNLIHFFNLTKSTFGLTREAVAFNRYKTIGFFVFIFLYTIEFLRNIFQILYNKNKNIPCVLLFVLILPWLSPLFGSERNVYGLFLEPGDFWWLQTVTLKLPLSMIHDDVRPNADLLFIDHAFSWFFLCKISVLNIDIYFAKYAIWRHFAL